MYYFDNEYLTDYLDLGSELKVYTNGQWYTVADSTDLADPAHGTAYDIHGKSIQFDYKALEQIEADGKQMTIDQLQDILSGENGKEDEGEGDDAKSEDDGGFAPDGADSGGGDGGPDELPPDNGEPEELGVEDDMPKDPTKKESVMSRHAFKKMLNEAVIKKTDYTGKFVRNIDENCKHFGTTGVVTEHWGDSIGYTIYSSKNVHMIGKKVDKDINSVEIISC